MSKGRSTHCWCCLLPSSVTFPLWSLAVSCLLNAAPTVNFFSFLSMSSKALRTFVPLSEFCPTAQCSFGSGGSVGTTCMLASKHTPPSVASAIPCHIRETRKSCQLVCLVTVMVNLQPWRLDHSVWFVLHAHQPMVVLLCQDDTVLYSTCSVRLL